MDFLLHSESRSEEDAIKYVQKWIRKYPDAGYGTRFYLNWIVGDNPKPYRSIGNGAGMRISPVGWVSNESIETKNLSDLVTNITHNTKQATLAAYVISHLILMARQGKSKQELFEFASRFYDLNFDYEDLVKNYTFSELCSESVPQALYCFFISNSFEDCLRITISIGGDCDTTAAISCAIAEAFYNQIDEDLINKIKNLLPLDMLKVIKQFKETYGGF